MKTRQRTKASQLPILTSREQAEACLHDYAQAVNARRTIQTWIDDEILKVKARYAADLEAADTLASQCFAQLHAWAEAHPEAFPRDRKSIVLAAGTLGFRTGTPKLALSGRQSSWDKVLDYLRRCARHFIRVKEEVDKESILASWSAADAATKAALAELLRAAGAQVKQEESFFVEPDLTKLSDTPQSTTSTVST